VKITYATAGVDIKTAQQAKAIIRRQAQTTFSPEVLSDIGFFSGLFELKNYHQPVLVSSVDGVGTKLKIVSLLGKNNTIGIDLVNHCINDILCCGAKPLFFLDYIGMGKLVPEQVGEIVEGITSACREVSIPLIGGETAEMPGIYAPGDYDLVGFIVGVVEREKIIDGRSIKAGDAILALPSSGLHTNGYSLVRQIFKMEPASLENFYPEPERTLAEELLQPHRSYYHQLNPAMPLIKGIAHITGGGIPGNVPRILPQGLGAHFHLGSWKIPPIFSLIQQQGNIDDEEMYRVFNMGIGMVVVISSQDAAELIKLVPEAKVVGETILSAEKKIILD
jgi:phosphoribosylformylglycinamidine cyclo-ligase